MTYEEKQQAKLERYQALAEKSKAESNAAYERSNSLSGMIPFGQPILIGHHSEGRHRRDIDRIDRLMDKSIESDKKAEYYAKKEENIINPTAISSDNPEAVNLLKEKLKHLEETREKYKEHNKKARSEGKPQLEPFHLTNLSNNIRSVKLRIAELENKAATPEIDEIINGVRLKVDKEENRVRLFFDNIPSESIRAELKSNGFRWSPFNKCWQRQISDWAVEVARDILKKVG